MGIKAWITINGNHIPIMDGESKMQAVGRFIKSKRDRAWSKKYKELQEADPDNDARARHGKAHIEATDRYIKSKGPTIKGQNKFFKGAKVQVEDSYSGEKRGEYRVKGKMDKDRSKMLYGSAVTGYDIEATGKFAEKLNKAGVSGKSQSNNYRMSLYPNKYKLKTQDNSFINFNITEKLANLQAKQKQLNSKIRRQKSIGNSTTELRKELTAVNKELKSYINSKQYDKDRIKEANKRR